MTAPHYIGEHNTAMRDIKPGWYAIEERGGLSFGPFSSREGCIKKIAPPTNGKISSDSPRGSN
jgi:hypothetical protein